MSLRFPKAHAYEISVSVAGPQLSYSSQGDSTKLYTKDQVLKMIKERDEMIDFLEGQYRLLLGLTERMDEHPENYSGPCECRTCRSY